MYPTISEFLKAVFGVDIPLPIQSYGFFVATAFLVGIWVMVKEMKRKEKQGLLQSTEKRIFIGEPAKPQEIIISAIVGFFIGYKLLAAVLQYSLFVANPGDFILSSNGSIIGGILGALISGFLTWKDKEKTKLDKPKWITKTIQPHEHAGQILFVAGITGLLGAKIFHNLENWDDLMADPMRALLSFSGLSFLGGLILGGISVYIYVKRNKISVVHFLDVVAIVLPLGYAIGRIGCQVSGDGCWGVFNEAFADEGTIPAVAYQMGHVASFQPPEWLSFLPDWLFAYTYPHNIGNEGVLIPNCTWAHCHVLPAPVFPTPIYETTMMLILFGVLSFLKKKIRIPGMLFAIYFTFAGLERFLIEKIRVNNLYKIGNFEITQAEIISSLMMITGTIAIFILYKNKDKMIAKYGD
ncbi:MAG: diacylglyceryl transferase, partial [Chlorobi bacterium]|nr:diacylglyceryl transferase [Chlorobiota bacterium]